MRRLLLLLTLWGVGSPAAALEDEGPSHDSPARRGLATTDLPASLDLHAAQGWGAVVSSIRESGRGRPERTRRTAHSAGPARPDVVPVVAPEGRAAQGRIRSGRNVVILGRRAHPATAPPTSPL